MEPLITGKKYDTIALWWYNQHNDSLYGLSPIKKAVSYCQNHGEALDVGCGCGGRVIKTLQQSGFKVHGLDVSVNMVSLAQKYHPEVHFEHGDICSWHCNFQFDFIVAWDSIFHLPLTMHEPVVSKLCTLLKKDGVLIYSFGDAIGEHESIWNNEAFYYSSIGINENLRVILQNGCEVKHLELDQFPLNHVYVIVKKL